MSCGAPAPKGPPSVVLIVLDTVRTDAVSLYGAVEGTTPTLDGLAAEGLAYRQVLATSSWTAPSHASLFTSRGVAAHQVGTPGRIELSGDLPTLAEAFRDAGYETAAFSENVLVGDILDLLRGFEYRRFSHIIPLGQDSAKFPDSPKLSDSSRLPDSPRLPYWKLDLEFHVEEWLEQRDTSRPFFLFVNIYEAHSPYLVRDENPWVEGRPTASMVDEDFFDAHSRLCDELPSERERSNLRGLYLGDVHEADAMTRKLLSQLRSHIGDGELISLITSDHGELFGERRLMGHEFSLVPEVLEVPLVVHGLSGVEPAMIEQPVSLLDVAPSLLAWSGLPVPPDFEGRLLPTTTAEPEERGMLAAYSDLAYVDPEEWKGIHSFESLDPMRASCGAGDKVFGGMAALLRHPFRFYWFERYPPELYDLSWDPAERSDLSAYRPDLMRRFGAEVEAFAEAARLAGAGAEGVEAISPEAIDALRAVGYVD